MIKVTISRMKDGRIGRFLVEGHAAYDEPGKDIVCAGVSAVTVGTVNAIEALLGKQLEARMKDGYLLVHIPGKQHDPEGKLQLLLESMVVMLESIKESYGAYIALKNTQI